MATYSDISSRLQDFLENDDTEFTTDNLDFGIDLAEQRISKELNVDGMILHKSASLTQGDPFLTKPTDAVAARSLMTVNPSTAKRRFLMFRTFEFCQDYWPIRTAEDEPLFFANWDADKWFVVPTPDAGYAVEASYEYRITGLSAVVTTTWISINHPDLLFYGSLLESGLFEKMGEEEKAPYQNNYDRALKTARDEVALNPFGRQQPRAGSENVTAIRRGRKTDGCTDRRADQGDSRQVDAHPSHGRAGGRFSFGMLNVQRTAGVGSE